MGNIVDLVHRDSGMSLIKLSTTRNLTTQVVYYGSVIDEKSVTFKLPLTGRTNFLMRARDDMLRVWSSAGGSTREYPYVRNVNINEHYAIYISSPSGPSATGTITRLRITGNLW